MEILLHDYLMLAVAALLAGLIDAAVGGGGLVQVPALFSAFPLAMPATFLVPINSPQSGVRLSRPAVLHDAYPWIGVLLFLPLWPH